MNVLISGVGGQGALLAARVLGRLAVLSGQEVKISEIHGMSQRGGRVMTHVCIAEKVYSPVIERGTADVVLGFELLEGFRQADYLHLGGMLIVNTQRIPPMSVLTGREVYPEDLPELFESFPMRIAPVDAVSLAIDAGDARAANMVLLGMLSKGVGLDAALWIEAIESTVPAKTIEINLRAFESGRKQVLPELMLAELTALVGIVKEAC